MNVKGSVGRRQNGHGIRGLRSEMAQAFGRAFNMTTFGLKEGAAFGEGPSGSLPQSDPASGNCG